jgi:hypothetical protein
MAMGLSGFGEGRKLLNRSDFRQAEEQSCLRLESPSPAWTVRFNEGLSFAVVSALCPMHIIERINAV